MFRGPGLKPGGSGSMNLAMFFLRFVVVFAAVLVSSEGFALKGAKTKASAASRFTKPLLEDNL